MQQTLARVLAATGGFLLAILWMDLMFDAQYFTAAPDAALTSIAAYYRRVTLDAGWMTWLIATVMLVTIVGVVLQARGSRASRVRRVLTPALAVVPIALALVVVFPAARELATTSDGGHRLSLARLIAWSHIVCFASIAAFITLQLTTSRSP
jgi:hypothetical protein